MQNIDQSDGSALSSITSKKTATAGLAAAWLVGMGGLIYGTQPEPPESAIFASATADETSHFNTPVMAAPDTDTSRTKPAAAITLIREAQTVDFIVRFENDIPELDACTQTFRRDPETAKEMFTKWATAYPALAGMSLKKASYSGEMILTWDTDIRRPLLTAEVDSKLALIKATPNVRYADPDYTAQAEGGR